MKLKRNEQGRKGSIGKGGRRGAGGCGVGLREVGVLDECRV